MNTERRWNGNGRWRRSGLLEPRENFRWFWIFRRYNPSF